VQHIPFDSWAYSITYVVICRYMSLCVWSLSQYGEYQPSATTATGTDSHRVDATVPDSATDGTYVGESVTAPVPCKVCRRSIVMYVSITGCSQQLNSDFTLHCRVWMLPSFAYPWIESRPSSTLTGGANDDVGDYIVVGAASAACSSMMACDDC